MDGNKKVCVFCGSREGAKPVYAETATSLGRELVKSQLDLVYGGGNVGLMGILADSVLASGGLVTGVIPEHLFELEVGHTGISDMRIVSSMHERKAVMASESSAFIAMPGGFGTFEEICEIITWAQLGLHHKPIGFLNIAGYFNPLMSAFDLGVTEKFISHQHRDMIICEDSVSTLVKRIADGIKNPDLVKF